jgi:hypothetical protein
MYCTVPAAVVACVLRPARHDSAAPFLPDTELARHVWSAQCAPLPALAGRRAAGRHTTAVARRTHSARLRVAGLDEPATTCHCAGTGVRSATCVLPIEGELKRSSLRVTVGSPSRAVMGATFLRSCRPRHESGSGIQHGSKSSASVPAALLCRRGAAEHGNASATARRCSSASQR